MGRATAFDFAGTGGRETWIGAVTLQPGSKTGAHHHGRHEVAVYVVKGRGQIRWGERLEFTSEVFCTLCAASGAEPQQRRYA